MPGNLLRSGSENSSIIADRAPVFLNIYDLTTLNGYLYWLGVGIFHSGIEVYGMEYAFGAHDYPTTGVFEVEPRSCPGFMFRRTIELGTTDLDPIEFREVIDRIACEYNGDMYHLIAKNCNHFSNDLSMRLTGRTIPGWVNRLASIGAFCNCLLPEGLQITAVQPMPEYHSYEGEDESDIDSDQEQYLLSTSNGDTESVMQDCHHDTAFKQMQNTH
eukprot:c27022_g1_i2 orf=499-1146(+)